MTKINIVLDSFWLVFATSAGLWHIWRESSQLRADQVNAAAMIEGAVRHCDVPACPITSLFCSPKSLLQTFMTDLLQHYNFTLWHSVWYIKYSQIVMQKKNISRCKIISEPCLNSQSSWVTPNHTGVCVSQSTHSKQLLGTRQSVKCCQSSPYEG